MAKRKRLDLASIDPRATPGLSGGKREGARELAQLTPRLAELQERLYANGVAGGRESLLLVLQGMDTSGKSGTVKHVLGVVSPLGVHYKGFKAPTADERRHDFLWRIKKELPPQGVIGVFDRSQYEDVVAVRVHSLVSRSTWLRRYDTINRFEAGLVGNGMTIVKCFLHISLEEQRARLLERLSDPTKYWKYNPADLTERLLWPDYQEAYADALTNCDTEAAPWHVIPADRKWYRNLAVTRLLVDALEAMKLEYPPASIDLELERRRLA